LRAQCANGCPDEAALRRESGFPPPPDPLPVGDAMAIPRAFERIRLLPVVARGADDKPADSLIVRVDDGKMWLDFAGGDLAGRALRVSVLLDGEGGRPRQLIATLDGAIRSVELAGQPRRDNGGTPLYLAPAAGDRDVRFAFWLPMPNESHPGTLMLLAQTLPNVDSAFLPSAIKAILAAMAPPAGHPEESLGLYPPLRVIEQRAPMLRRVQSALRDRGVAFIAPAHADDRLLRQAWAMAICEPAARTPDPDDGCWRRFAAADPDAATGLRADIAQLSSVYAELPPGHPLRIRLRKLEAALSFKPAPLVDK